MEIINSPHNKMATAEDENAYDTRGTVLYCTVPLMPAADEAATQERSDAENVPLDYATALAVLEAVHARGGAATSSNGKGNLPGGLTCSRRQSVGAAATTLRSAGRLSVTAADGGHPPVGAAAGASGMAPAPPQQRVGLSNMTARYGPYGGTQRTPASVSFKGGLSSNGRAMLAQQQLKSTATGVGGPSQPNSQVVNFDDGTAGLFDSVAAHNVYVAKAARARGAAVAAAQSSKKNLAGLKGTSTTSMAAAAARLSGGRALTVADAMQTLFPITPVEDDRHDDDDGAGEDAEGARGPTRRKSFSVSTSTSAASETDEAASAEASRAASLPRLWRRADVGHVSRLDVVLLYLHLQRRCASESARPCGVVCPNRERLYSDVLQELIRQVTLLCPERGLLLDELARSMQQSMETYDVLLDSASQYAVRKSTERDLNQHLFAEKAELETEVRRREHRVSEWRAKYAGLQKRLEEQQAADAKLHEQEIAYTKRANAQIVNEIKRLASEAEKTKEK